jgi:heme-degrading monooxygenase HmoA
MMTTIVTGSQPTTSITTYRVRPELQQRLIDILVLAAENVLQKLPGFISANIHKSMDGTQVLNYSQWESREAFDAIRQNETVLTYTHAAWEIATIEPHIYEVVAIIHADKIAPEGQG